MGLKMCHIQATISLRDFRAEEREVKFVGRWGWGACLGVQKVSKSASWASRCWNVWSSSRRVSEGFYFFIRKGTRPLLLI